jgi:hypothetical protein
VSLKVKPIQKKVEMEYTIEDAGVNYQMSDTRRDACGGGAGETDTRTVGRECAHPRALRCAGRADLAVRVVRCVGMVVVSVTTLIRVTTTITVINIP